MYSIIPRFKTNHETTFKIFLGTYCILLTLFLATCLDAKYYLTGDYAILNIIFNKSLIMNKSSRFLIKVVQHCVSTCNNNIDMMKESKCEWLWSIYQLNDKN
ncbi:uncharacterized protein BX663DRAFT_546510 [Cokeromyces recurvatus]|uniref:uncharacterized protein n=1 Tax=Cokeromyces recurvatus TaxID=90255 RepID=UPI00221E8707|nr:uncharacterized protein BX663DRAFT_546510 [Cokeromyces recurvatus]KAI7898289.1 hypothetical protein BX663DRAFT_546510 [Cokeromyces recurvatus]